MTTKRFIAKVPPFHFPHGEYSCIPGDWWIIGFDTCHLDDTPEEWDRQAVID